MFPKTGSFLTCAVLSGAFLCSQSAGSQTAPSAFVYVTSNYSGSNNRVVGFVSNASGQLSQISGSPWGANLGYMAVNGKFLFGSDNIATDNGRNIFSYLIESNGALKYVGATNIQNKGTGNSCNDGSFLTLDHTGQFLYQLVLNSNGCNDVPAYQSWSVNQTTGLLNYLATSGPDRYMFPPLNLSANNLFAYAAGCNLTITSFGAFKKQSNGALQLNNIQYNFPTPPPTTSYWTECIGYSTPDPTNHMAVDITYPSGENDRIATYAINTTNGNLTTSSTYSNMHATQVAHVRWTSMAPSGKLLAIAGDKGLQLFNFNPSGQATPHTGLLTSAPIDMVQWDNKNHLYAISNADSRIYVFAYHPTTGGVSSVSGSPFVVAHPVALTVQPK
ncbi:hypothetical protein [Occallatibacter savannae]|uniref:hypothetical protein n=1 Tax=Occallatibacter savannae TaxID=1002691 RepID=UPI000D69B202|nr:hypothetical protein [Occallatibacter savannae]